MKKILYFIIILLLVITKISVKASEVTLVKERIGDLYTYYYDENYGRHRFLYLNKYLFGENYAYCLELGKNINGNLYSFSTSFTEANINSSDLEYIKLVSFYGYDYPGHETDRFYMAAQELIWIRLSNIYVKWAVSMNSNNLIDVSEEKEIISDLVSNHYIKPSFDNEEVDIVKGETKILTDTNNVISTYESDNNYLRIEGNKLIIDGNIQDEEIVLRKKGNNDKVFLLYTNGTSQKMMSSGKVNQQTSKVKLNILGGSVKINKEDSETGSYPQGEASLKGAKYSLYDKNGTVKGNFITGNQDLIENLAPGEYYIKEINPSPGYRLDENIYTINISKDNLNIEVNLYEEVIKRKIDIFKVFASSETGELIPEENVVFEVYDKDNNLVKELTTDGDGYISIILPYGSYTLKQKTTQEGYEKIKDYNITIDEYDDRPIYKLFTDAPIKAKVKIIKKDFDTKEIITNSDAKFKIYDVINNRYVSFKVTYPEIKEIDTFNLSGGTFVTPEELPPGTYRLYEVDEPIDGYLYNDEGVEFKIGESSNFINDSDYGKILEVSFYNKPVKGKIEVYKYGEDITYENNTYKYHETLLSDVKFNLFSKKDIYQNSKLIYSEDELIEELSTDENGYTMIDNLPLGEYYLKEASSNNDNEISPKKYDISLSYKDQYTEKILQNIDVYNYISKGKLVINKHDKNTNEPLSNTLIEIRKDRNTVIYKGYTNNSGQIIIDDLKYGDYYLAETEAATGYQILDERISFTIDKEETTIDLYNERINVPNTGISSKIYIPFLILCFILSIFLIIIFHYDKRIIILCIIIIFLSFIIIFIHYFQIYQDKTNNSKAVEAYLNNQIDDAYDEKYRYNALLEIPSINLKRGVLDIDNQYNKADYNIELVRENENTIVLASHNGDYYNSYFGNLSDLELGDIIYYYQDGLIYKYIYSDSYEIKKDGHADLYHKNDKKSIILITCKDNTEDTQVVHIGYLKEINPFLQT